MKYYTWYLAHQISSSTVSCSPAMLPTGKVWDQSFGEPLLEPLFFPPYFWHKSGQIMRNEKFTINPRILCNYYTSIS